MVRIVTWNCNQGLAKKAHRLIELEPDIAVVPEAGRQAELGDGRMHRVAWAGRNPTKGLAVFVRDGIEAGIDTSWDEEREWFLPVRTDLDGGLDILAIWALNQRSKEPRPTRGRTLSAIQHYRGFLSGEQSVVIGDFNNNALWDKPSNPSFSLVVDELSTAGYESVYHARTGELHGEESAVSLYWRRDLTTPYLVDHAFVPRDWMSRVRRFDIGLAQDWLEFSDHMPLILDLADDRA